MPFQLLDSLTAHKVLKGQTSSLLLKDQLLLLEESKLQVTGFFLILLLFFYQRKQCMCEIVETSFNFTFLSDLRHLLLVQQVT